MSEQYKLLLMHVAWMIMGCVELKGDRRWASGV